MTSTYQKISSSRLLPERSRIEFHYPGQGTDSPQIIFLPFYENPEIRESQSTNYAEYNPVGRAGSLYAYLGAKSRKFKVDMIYTLPHLAQHAMGVSRFLRVMANTGPEAERNAFFMDARYSPAPLPGDSNHSLGAACAKLYTHMLADKFGISIGDNPFTQDIEGIPSFVARLPIDRPSDPTITAEFLGRLDEFGEPVTERIPFMSRIPGDVGQIINVPSSDRDTTFDVIDTLLFFIAILRTSVTNNAMDPMVGPPLLRLSFGTMYQNVPCICKNYNISWEEDSGYDLETLTPRHLKIQLNLEEIRVGDFKEYTPAAFVQNDNLTGWESALEYQVTDPLPLHGYWEDT